MPYFAWKGVDLTGAHRKGTLCARSHAEVDARLFKRDIALLHTRQVKKSFFGRRVGKNDIITFFQQLATLVSTGIRIPEALEIIAQQSDGPLQEIIYAIADDVNQGLLVSEALAKYPSVFDQRMVSMVHVGEDAGCFVLSLQAICAYLESAQEFKKKLRSAALMPLITFSFFCVIAAIIFVFIIPHFAQLFSTMGKSIPPLTSLLIRVSTFMRSRLFAGVVLACVGTVMLFLFIAKRSERVRGVLDAFVLRIPCIGAIVSQSAVVSWIQSLALLVDGGVSVVPALTIAQTTVSNSQIAATLCDVTYAVDHGSSLSHALLAIDHDGSYAPLIATVRVAEETGQLGMLLHKAGNSCQKRLQDYMQRCSSLLQPLLMLILGLLISLLICAVYLPIFSLSHAL